MIRCPNCMRLMNDARCVCGYDPGSAKRINNALPEGTLLDSRWEVGRALAISYQSIAYIGWDNQEGKTVLITEFFPRYVAARAENKVDVIVKKNDAEFIRARELYRADRSVQPECLKESFAKNQTAYRVYEYLGFPEKAEVKADELLDEMIYFRDEQGKPLMTVNALKVPEMPQERPWRASKYVQNKKKRSRRARAAAAAAIVILAGVVGCTGYLLLKKQQITIRLDTNHQQLEVVSLNDVPLPAQTPDANGVITYVLNEKRGNYSFYAKSAEGPEEVKGVITLGFRDEDGDYTLPTPTVQPRFAQGAGDSWIYETNEKRLAVTAKGTQDITVYALEDEALAPQEGAITVGDWASCRDFMQAGYSLRLKNKVCEYAYPLQLDAEGKVAFSVTPGEYTLEIADAKGNTLVKDVAPWSGVPDGKPIKLYPLFFYAEHKADIDSCRGVVRVENEEGYRFIAEDMTAGDAIKDASDNLAAWAEEYPDYYGKFRTETYTLNKNNQLSDNVNVYMDSDDMEEINLTRWGEGTEKINLLRGEGTITLQCSPDLLPEVNLRAECKGAEREKAPMTLSELLNTGVTPFAPTEEEQNCLNMLDELQGVARIGDQYVAVMKSGEERWQKIDEAEYTGLQDACQWYKSSKKPDEIKNLVPVKLETSSMLAQEPERITIAGIDDTNLKQEVSLTPGEYNGLISVQINNMTFEEDVIVSGEKNEASAYLLNKKYEDIFKRLSALKFRYKGSNGIAKVNGVFYFMRGNEATPLQKELGISDEEFETYIRTADETYIFYQQLPAASLGLDGRVKDDQLEVSLNQLKLKDWDSWETASDNGSYTLSVSAGGVVVEEKPVRVGQIVRLMSDYADKACGKLEFDKTDDWNLTEETKEYAQLLTKETIDKCCEDYQNQFVHVTLILKQGPKGFALQLTDENGEVVLRTPEAGLASEAMEKPASQMANEDMSLLTTNGAVFPMGMHESEQPEESAPQAANTPAPEMPAEPTPETTAEPTPETSAEPAPETTAESEPERVEEPVPGPVEQSEYLRPGKYTLSVSLDGETVTISEVEILKENKGREQEIPVTPADILAAVMKSDGLKHIVMIEANGDTWRLYTHDGKRWMPPEYDRKHKHWNMYWALLDKVNMTLAEELVKDDKLTMYFALREELFADDATEKRAQEPEEATDWTKVESTEKIGTNIVKAPSFEIRANEELYFLVKSNESGIVWHSRPVRPREESEVKLTNEQILAEEEEWLYNIQNNCDHVWDRGTVIVSATCYRNGSIEKICTKCDIKRRFDIPMTAHSEKKGESTATCTEGGYTDYVCTVCRNVRKEPVKALGHEWVDDKESLVEATCTKPGSKNQHCERCEKTKLNVEIKATGHNWDEDHPISGEEATCGHEGKAVYPCKNSGCTETDERTIPKSEHTFDENNFEIPDEGKTVYKCTVCDTIIKIVAPEVD